jgi:hypothetical protein
MKNIKILKYIILSIVITLFLSPEKYYYGLGFLAFLLAFNLKIIFKLENYLAPIKFYSPLIILFIYYLFIQKFYNLNQSSVINERYILGFIIFIAFYLLNTSKNYSNFYLIISFFIVPAAIHLIYMYIDVLNFFEAKNYIELIDIKNVPRVGRRYLSTVLLSALLTSSAIVLIRTQRGLPIFPYCFCVFSLLSLGLLDTRASYVALFLSLFFLIFVKNLRALAGQAWKIYAKEIPLFPLINTIVLVLFIFLALSSGSERWSRFIGTTAYVFQSQAETSADKIASSQINNENILNKPEGWNSNLSPEEIKRCMRNNELRCVVEQSVYLRLTRLIEAINIVKIFPFGVGYREEFYESLNSNELIISGIKVRGGGLGDNLLVENIISFGYIGVLLMMIFCGHIIYLSIVRKTLTNERVYCAIFSFVLFSCIVRMHIDGFALGLWGYFNALLGIFVSEIKRD